MTEKTTTFPAGRRSLCVEHRYSAAIRSGDLLFVSRRVGSQENEAPEPDSRRQVRLAFNGLHTTPATTGCTFDDIINVTSLHIDPENQFEDIMVVRNEILSTPPYPNRATMGITWLAGSDFEIEVMTRIPER